MLSSPQYEWTYVTEDGAKYIKRTPGFVKDDPNTVYITYDHNGFVVSHIYCPYVPETDPNETTINN